MFNGRLAMLTVASYAFFEATTNVPIVHFTPDVLPL